MQNYMANLKHFNGFKLLEAEFLPTDNRRILRAGLRKAAQNLTYRRNRMIATDIYKDLMEAAAFSLIGEKVEIQFRQPVNVSGLGHIYYTEASTLVMDIRPGLSDITAYKIFLHEIGHYASGHLTRSGYQPTNYHLLPSNSLPAPSKQQFEAYEQSPDELEAETFAREMGAFAARKALERYANNSVGTQLRVLAETQLLKPEGD